MEPLASWWDTSVAVWREELGRLDTVLRDALPIEPAEASWATPHERHALSPTLALRTFVSGDGAPGGADARDDGGGETPVLVVTPQVNHSYIADFSPRQSLVRTLLRAGVSCVGVTDWLPPAAAHEHTIADSVDDVLKAAEKLGGRVHLVGLCQGGWQSAIAAVHRPACAASLTVAAGPIDAHAGATLLHAFTFGLPMAFFEWIVRAGGGNAPGAMIAQGFDLLRPFERFVYNPAALYFRAHDPDFVERYGALRNWYRLNKDVAGALYLEAVRELFKENRLARGTFRLRGEPIRLDTLRCPIHLVAGTRDHLTPAAQVFALERLAPAAPCRRYLIDAGHIGVFMGRNALKTVWPQIAATFARLRR